MASLHAVPLGPGQSRSGAVFLSDLYRAASGYASIPDMWDGLFRLACMTKDRPFDEPVAGKIQKALEGQTQEGQYPGTVAENLATARAVLAFYEYANGRDTLKSLLLFCSWVSRNWADVIACNEIRRQPADMMELLIKLYRYTGKTAILSLCDRLRRESLNWTAVLNTYSIKRPTSMMASWLEMRAGIDREGDQDDGAYTRQYLMTHAETLADGMRATTMNALYSGSGDEADAAKTGWTRIQRWHGAVCGGTTADEALQGNDPSVAIDAASLCSWADALVAQFMLPDRLWAAAELDVLVPNALAAAVMDGKLNPYQRVNFVEKTLLVRECYHAHSAEEQRRRCLIRLCRTAGRVMSSAVMTMPKGVEFLMYLDGEYDLPMNEKAFRFSVVHLSPYSIQITIQGKEEIGALVRLRIPDWMKNIQLAVNGRSQSMEVKDGFIEIHGTWKHGDVISLVWVPEIRVVETFHQGQAVMLGNTLMTLNVAERDWSVALLGAPRMEEGQVHVTLGHVDHWEEINGITRTLPVQPEVTGETEDAVLVPYISAPVHMSVFPKGVKV